MIKRMKEAKAGRYVATVTDAKEECVGTDKRMDVAKVYFKLRNKSGALFEEKTICIFANYDRHKEKAAYKFMEILGELDEDYIDCERILRKANGKSFIITIAKEGEFNNIVDVRLKKKKTQTASGVKAKP